MKKILLISIIGFLMINSGQAIYYNIPYFARSAGLGEATVSALGDISGIYNNPAVMNTNTASFNLTEWLVDTRAGSFVGSYNIRDYFTLGGGINYFSYGTMREFDELGNPLDYFSAGLWQYQISLATQIYQHISLGIGAKILHQNIATATETKVLNDIGLIYYSDLFNVGASLHDLTDLRIDAGVSVKPFKDLMMLAAVKYHDEAVIRAGIEYNLKPVAFRIGFNDNHISAGIGYTQKGYTFDYAIADYGQIGLTHQFSITIK